MMRDLITDEACCCVRRRLDALAWDEIVASNGTLRPEGLALASRIGRVMSWIGEDRWRRVGVGFPLGD